MEFPEITKEEANQIPYPYVYIENDRSYRELDDDEREYLETPFHPNDGARPYIKFRFESLTPDNKLHGFLKRKKLPKGLKAGEITKPKPWWKLW